MAMSPRLRKSGWRVGTLLASLSMLAGCAGVVGSGFTETRSAYSRAALSYAADGRDLAVAVTGNPTKLDNSAFIAKVEDILNKTNGTGLNIRLTTNPGPSAQPPYKIHLVFISAENSESPNRLTPSQYCSEKYTGTTTPAEPGNIVIALSVFCAGSQFYSTATSWVTLGKDGLNDTILAALTRRALLETLPVYGGSGYQRNSN